MTVSHGPGNSAYRVGISPDGARTISSGFDGKLRLADAATGDELLTVHIGGSFLYCAGFSPDGVYMVGGGKNPRVMLAGTKTRVATLKGHRHNVNNARFSPDSARVATGSGAATGWVAVTGPDVSTGSGAGVPPGVDRGVGAGVGTAVAQPEGSDAAAGSGATVGVAA